tara:strand:- start:214 stop:582 length:369 start_codon:yes stop_codon:yes gene_type:complete
MAHFATLNNDNVVIAVEVVNNAVITDDDGKEQEQLGIDFLQQIYKNNNTYKQTSYNGNLRANYAELGGTYDPVKDAFIHKKPFPSWVLNGTKWEAPKTKPNDDKPYIWDEDSSAWVEHEQPE